MAGGTAFKVFDGQEWTSVEPSEHDKIRLPSLNCRTFLNVGDAVGAVSAEAVQGVPPENAIRWPQGELKENYEE